METKKEFKSVMKLAFSDISKHIIELQAQNNLSYADNCYVTPNYMLEFHSKQTARFNRQLGIHKINK